MKKFIITESEKNRILGMHKSRTSRQYLNEVEKNTKGCPCGNGKYNMMCCDIELNHNDSTKLYNELTRLHNELTSHSESHTLSHLLNDHPKNHTFLDFLNHNVHAHLDLNSKHLSLQFPHLGKDHNIELDLKGSYPTSHGNHDDGNGKPNIVFGGTLKIPITSFEGHHKGKHQNKILGN